MRTLNPLIKVLPLAAAVLISLPDVVLAQGFNFQNPITLSIGGPGLSDSRQVVVTVNTGTINTLVVGAPVTQAGGNWLCADNNSNLSTITVSVGTAGCGTGTAGLTPNTSYNGQVPFTVNGSSQILTVILNVGTTSTGVGLTANPNPLTFNVGVGSGSTSANVNIFNSGAVATLTNVSGTTTTGQNWLQPFLSGTQGVVTVNINPSFLSAGSYTGTVFVTTTTGSMTFTVNLNVGTGGSGFGLAANPNPVSFNVASGSGITSSNVGITFNGSPIAVTNITSSTTTGQNWLQVANTGFTGTLQVTVNPSSLFTGSYTGNVTAFTAQGQINFTVNLTVGGGGSSSGLVANPNPIVLNVPFGAGVTSQNIAVTSNGFPITITSSSATTANGQPWLQSFVSGNTGFVTASVNPQILNSGSYTGSIFISTTAGTLTIQVSLTVGGGTNSAGLVATPNPVNFNIPLVGSGTQPQTVTVTFNGTAATITSVSNPTGGQNWLIPEVSATPGAVTIRINGANLTAQTYSATLTINTTAGSLNLPVNLTVGGSSTGGLVATPNPLFLNAPIGGGSSSQNVSITFNGSPATVTAVSTTTSTGQNWLQATTSGLSGTVTVTVTPSLLGAGSYSGTVSVTTTVGQVNFQVNLTVGGSGGTAGVIASPNPVTLTAAAGGAVPSQTVSVTVNGAPATITGISSSTSTGVNWLQPFTGGTQGSITVNANTSGLQAGSYSGTVTVTTTSGTTTFQVNLTVGSTTGTSGLVATPNPVTFTETAPGQAGSQTISVTLNGAPQTVTAATFAPLQIGLTFVDTRINTDGTATITVNSVVTTPGSYQGNLTLYTTAGSNVVVPVTLQFGSGGGATTGLIANPSAATFNVQTGGSVPAQTLLLTFNGFATTVNSVTATTTTGQLWLLPSLSSTPGGVTINVNALGLLPGTYSGTVAANTASGTLTLPVTLVVGGGGPSGPTVIVTPVTLSPVNYQVGGASPQPQTISISMSGGGALGFTVTGSAFSGGSWLSVSQTGGTTPGSATVSINTSGLTTPGTFQGSVVITVPGATNSPVTLPITLTVTAPVVTAPVVVAVQNGASNLPTPLSPGLNIVIFGSNMGPATTAQLVVGSNGALSTSVAGTQVTFDGVPAAIIYTSSNEVSVMVPYAVANRATTTLVVTYNGVSSAPTSYRVAEAAPGIFTINRSGSGQGAILNQDNTINSASNPEVVGRFIQIYATGEGQTTPGGSDGALTPNRLPTPTPNLPVTVTIGGVPVPASDITFAGEAPTIVSGVMQINARIPPGVGTGPVSIVIRVGGIPSQANVTVSVR